MSNLTLATLCTDTYIQAHFPAVDFFEGITLDPSTVNATAVYNASASGSVFFPNYIGFDYCSVTFSYSHNGRDDVVDLTYWLPEPDKFENRYLATGGGGYAINSGTGTGADTMSSLPGGLEYGAVAGLTDGGFGIFQDQAIEDFLLANGTLNYENIYMFG